MKSVDDALRPYEADLAALMREYFRSLERSVLARLDGSGYVPLGPGQVAKTVAAATPFSEAEWNAKLASKTTGWTYVTFVDAANLTYEAGTGAMAQFDPADRVVVGGAFDVKDQRAVQYMNTKPQTFAVQINHTTYAQLQATLMQGIDRGENLALLKSRVQQYFSTATAARVEAIARTETVGVSNAGALAGAMQSPAFVTKTWIAALDIRTRLTHIAAHNQTVAKDEPFTVGAGQAQAPHLFTLAREVVNCRCTMVFGTDTAKLQFQPDPPAAAPPAPAPAPPTVPPPIPVPAPVPVPAAPAPAAPAPATTPRPRQPRTPRTPRVRPAPPVVAPPNLELAPEQFADFPDDVDGLEVVTRLKGSTGAELVRDPKTGVQFVRKRGANEAHLQEEMTADAVYRALGINVPEFKSYRDSQGRLVKLSRFITVPTTELGKLTPTRKTAAIEKLREGFVVDALLGNWDVIGLDSDNVLVTADNTPYRIDNGGALRFRAQGQPKAAGLFNEGVLDLWGLRDPGINPSAAAVFGGMSLAEMARQAKALVSKWDSIDAEALFADPAAYGILVKRVDSISRFARQVEVMQADKYQDKYLERFTRSYQTLMQAGMWNALPTQLILGAPKPRYMTDIDGTLFDHLRTDRLPNGERSALAILQKAMKDAGGSYADIQTWASNQAGGSWTVPPLAVKAWYAAQRTAPWANYYRRHNASGHIKLGQSPTGNQLFETNHDEALEGLQKMLNGGIFAGASNAMNAVQQGGRSTTEFEAAMSAAVLGSFETTFTMQNAFSYMLLERCKTDMRRDGVGDPYTLRLIRTEVDEALRNNIAKNEVKVIPRGAMESTSAITGIVVNGNKLTITDVPIHRVMGTYFQGRNDAGEYPYDMFLGIDENEIVAHLEGLPTRYIGQLDGDGGERNYGPLRNRILSARTLNDIPDNMLS